jgi:hypothetical protein
MQHEDRFCVGEADMWPGRGPLLSRRKACRAPSGLLAGNCLETKAASEPVRGCSFPYMQVRLNISLLKIQLMQRRS